MRKKKMRAVVIGCGTLGAHVANLLVEAGYAVGAVDVEATAFRRLPLLYGGETVEGDGTELAVLRNAKVEDANLVVATTREDNANLMIAQVAKAEFRVPRVFARVHDPEREPLCRRLGVDPICPSSVAVDITMQAIREGGGQ